MSFSAELPGGAFAAACARAASIAPANAKIPITGNALLRAEEGGLSIAATNLDQAITTTLEGSCAGAVTASAARLSVAAARLDGDAPVKLSATETTLTISQGRAVHRLPVLPAADFPDTLTDRLQRADPWQVPAARFAAMLDALKGCIDPGDPRFYLAGAFLDFSEEGPAMVATDGNGMGAIAMGDMQPPARKGLILPHECFRAIADIAKGAETLDLRLGDEAITVEAAHDSGERRLRSKLVAGEYPQWRRVVPAPDTRKTRITIAAAAFAAALARVGIVEGDVAEGGKGKRRPPSILLEVGEAEIVASSHNQAGEQAMDACACERLQGGDVKVRIATRLLNWAAPSLGQTDTLELGFGEDPLSPVTITRAGDTERRDMRIVMPMRG